MAEAVEILRAAFGTAPQGWYTGRDSPQTRRLVVEHGGMAYDADSYADDLPYWTPVLARGAEGQDVWICRRIDIARHWMSSHPAAPGLK